jgi:hypothetical protein
MARKAVEWGNPRKGGWIGIAADVADELTAPWWEADTRYRLDAP